MCDPIPEDPLAEYFEAAREFEREAEWSDARVERVWARAETQAGAHGLAHHLATHGALAGKVTIVALALVGAFTLARGLFTPRTEARATVGAPPAMTPPPVAPRPVPPVAVEAPSPAPEVTTPTARPATRAAPRVTTDVEDPVPRLLREAGAMRATDPAGALERYHRVTTRYATHARARDAAYRRGDMLRSAGRFELAAEVFRDARRLPRSVAYTDDDLWREELRTLARIDRARALERARDYQHEHPDGALADWLRGSGLL